MDKLINYFDQRYEAEKADQGFKNCGPIITLSRQTGCDAVAIAAKLVDLLNKHYNTDKWHWVDKQILTEAAKVLKTDRSKVRSFLDGSQFTGLSEMIMAISGDYISNDKIRNVILKVVKTICSNGYAVLVGRGGVSISRGLEKAVHIRLQAPFYWRVENIIRKRKYDIETAEEFVVDTDEKRYNIILNFLEKKPLNLDYLFDTTINRSSYSIDQISELILESYLRRMATVKKHGISSSQSLNNIYG